MTLILGFIQNMLVYMLAMLPPVVIWRVIAARRRRNDEQQPSPKHEIRVVLFVLFMVGLLSQAVVPKLEWREGELRVVGGLFENPASHLNLIPGYVFLETYRAVFEEHELSSLTINLIGNIVMFMPIGFCLPLLWANFEPCKRTIFAGFCVSLFIELSQLPFARKTDVDDLWLNTLGVWLGYLVWKARHKNCQKTNTMAGNKEGSVE